MVIHVKSKNETRMLIGRERSRDTAQPISTQVSFLASDILTFLDLT